jgi:D-alanyl-lipoteichoic acid acyltransferase DltB (MBOAT superfamily)
MLGFELPINFDTPYRAVSMIDFWKRWHMTMTRFFMMYVYSPIALAWGRAAMNRGMGRWRTFSVAVAAPILVTFLISGLWHGAGWTFVMFGLVNGIGLVTNHAWRQAKLPPLPGVAGWLMTMITVTVSFVYFRAADMTQANDMLAAMVSPSTLAVPNWLSGWADRHALPWAVLGLFSSGAFTAQMAALLAVAAALSVILPNWSKTWSRLVPGARLAVATAAMMYMVGSWLGEPRTFIYFQF